MHTLLSASPHSHLPLWPDPSSAVHLSLLSALQLVSMFSCVQVCVECGWILTLCVCAFPSDHGCPGNSFTPLNQPYPQSFLSCTHTHGFLASQLLHAVVECTLSCPASVNDGCSLSKNSIQIKICWKAMGQFRDQRYIAHPVPLELLWYMTVISFLLQLNLLLISYLLIYSP